MALDIARHFGLNTDPFAPGFADPALMAAALTQPEAHQFVASRLTAAGGAPDLFHPRAIDVIWGATAGDPQRLRWMAGFAMVEAALDNAPRVDPHHAEMVAARSGFAGSPPPQPRPAAAPPSRLAAPPPRLREARRFATPFLAGLAAAALTAPIADAVLAPPMLNTKATPTRSKPALRPSAPDPAPVEDAALAPGERAVQEPVPIDGLGMDDTPVAPVARSPAPAPQPAPAQPAQVVPVPPAALEPDAKPEPRPLASEPAEASAPVRVFVHFVPEDREEAEEVADRLEARGFPVAGLRAVEWAVRRPDTRYYYSADADAARAISEELTDFTGQLARARDLHDYPRPPRPGTIEVWLPPSG